MSVLLKHSSVCCKLAYESVCMYMHVLYINIMLMSGVLDVTFL